MKKLKWLKIILVLIVIPFVVVGSIYSLNINGFFNIDKIDVVVENMVDQPRYLQPLIKKIDAIVEVERGISLWDVNLDKINNKLMNFQWIDSIRLSRTWPSQLSVSIKVKEVKALVARTDGLFLPVVDGGLFLDPVDAGQAPDVALLLGQQFEKKPELRKKVVQLVNELPQEGTFSKKTISEIHYDEKEGFWLSLIKDNIQVKMGHDQVSTKSARVSQVIDYIESRKMNARVIDANLSKKVLVRLRKDP